MTRWLPILAVVAVAILGVVIFGFLAVSAYMADDTALMAFMVFLATLIGSLLLAFLLIIWLFL